MEYKSLNIIGFDSYKINENGVVLNKMGKQMKHCIVKGYWHISFSKNNIKKNFKIHRLIAMVFIPNPLGYNIVNHINGIKTDNSIKNLEWTTSIGNTNHYHNKNLKERNVSKKQISIRLMREILKDNPDIKVRELIDMFEF